MNKDLIKLDNTPTEKKVKEIKNKLAVLNGNIVENEVYTLLYFLLLLASTGLLYPVGIPIIIPACLMILFFSLAANSLSKRLKDKREKRKLETTKGLLLIETEPEEIKIKDEDEFTKALRASVKKSKAEGRWKKE